MTECERGKRICEGVKGMRGCVCNEPSVPAFADRSPGAPAPTTNTPLGKPNRKRHKRIREKVSVIG